MTFDWKQYVEPAKQLEKQCGENEAHAEVKARTAVSRAYFGAFGHVRRYAEQRLRFVSRGEVADHGNLRKCLKGKFSGVAASLERLRQWRNEADYADSLSVTDVAAWVASALRQADQVFRLLNVSD